MINRRATRYYFFSSQSEKLSNTIASGLGKKYVLGTIVVSGKILNFTGWVTDSNKLTFTDAKLVATMEPDQDFPVTEPHFV